MEKALTHNLLDKRSALNVVANLIEAGEFNLALDKLTAIPDDEALAGRANCLRGRIFVGQFQYDDAINAFLKGINCAPNFLYNYLALANLYFDKGRLSDAQKVVEMALDAKIDSYWPRLLQVRIFRERGFIADALVKAQNLLECFPADFHINLALFQCLLKAGYLKEAQALVEKLNASNEADHFRLLMMRARLYWASYDLDNAIDCLKIALKIEPASVEAHDLLVLIYLMRCDYKLAKLAFSEAVSVKQSHPNFRIREEAKGGMNYLKLLDFGTNPFALDGLEKVRELPISERIYGICQVLEVEPNHLGSCVALLTELRRAQVFTKTIPLEGLDHQILIPRKIVQYWSDKETPSDVGELMRSARLSNPSYEHFIFDDKSAENFIREYCDPDVLRAYLMANHPAMRADIFRLAYLWINGGIYIDADDRCIANLSPILERGFDLIVMQEGDGFIGNNFLAASPGQPWIADALQTISNFVANRQADNIWMVSGPGALTGSFTRFYLSQLSNEKLFRLPQGVKVLPQYFLERFICMHLPVRYKKEGMHWADGDKQTKSIYRLPLGLK